MITCDRCGLTLQGFDAHATAEDCLRHLVPRYAAMAGMTRKQAEYAERLEQRLERAQLQSRTAEHLHNATLRDVHRERNRSARLELARNTVYSALLRAQAQATVEKRRYAKVIARLRKLAGAYLEDAA